jgi:hypothetical protein
MKPFLAACLCLLVALAAGADDEIPTMLDMFRWGKMDVAMIQKPSSISFPKLKMEEVKEVESQDPQFQVIAHLKTKMAISPEPGFLIVDAVGQFNNMHNDSAALYYWRLEVFRAPSILDGLPRPEPKLLWSRDYDRTEFSVPAGQFAPTRFHERLPMPHGRYVVRLSAFEVKRSVTKNRDGPRLIPVNGDGTLHGPTGSFTVAVKSYSPRPASEVPTMKRFRFRAAPLTDKH